MPESVTFWYKPSTPEELNERPWLHSTAAAFFEILLEPGMKVLEHGSGGSTIWLSKRVKQVTAIEHDAKWFAAVKAKAGKNVKVVLWDERRLPKISGTFDLLFIDGEPVEDRKFYLEAAPRLVKPGGWVVLDNANRPEYAAEREALKALCDKVTGYRAQGGTYLVTDFYRLRETE